MSLTPRPSGPFQRVNVDYMIRGTARITWSLARHILDPNPATWSYQLQVSTHNMSPSYKQDGTPRTDDWIDVGSPVVNAAQLTDSTRRAFGKSLTVAYRVKLTTSTSPLREYWSPPASTLGNLNKQDWLRAQEVIRKELLSHSKATSVSGWLLRRKRTGTTCSKCIDPATGDVTLSKCDVCKGTRFTDGYFAAIPNVWCRLDPTGVREHRNLQGPGSEKQDTTTGRMVAVPDVESFDVWVSEATDLRYILHTITPAAVIRHVPLVLSVEARQAAFDDVVYTIPLTGG